MANEGVLEATLEVKASRSDQVGLPGPGIHYGLFHTID